RVAPGRAMMLAASAGVVRWTTMSATTSVAALAVVQPLHGCTFALLHLACMRVIGATVPPRLAGTAQSLYAAGATAVTGALTMALFLALSFVSFAADAPRANLGGPVGHALAGTSLRAFGLAAYLFPIYLGYFTVALLRRGAEGFGGMRLVGALVVVVDVAALA